MATKTTNSITRNFTLDKETKNTYVYTEQVPNDAMPLFYNQKVWIPKNNFPEGDAPQEIMVEVHIN